MPPHHAPPCQEIFVGGDRQAPSTQVLIGIGAEPRCLLNVDRKEDSTGRRVHRAHDAQAQTWRVLAPFHATAYCLDESVDHCAAQRPPDATARLSGVMPQGDLEHSPRLPSLASTLTARGSRLLSPSERVPSSHCYSSRREQTQCAPLLPQL